MQLNTAEQMLPSPENGYSPTATSAFNHCGSQHLNPHIAAAYNRLSYQTLRSRRAEQAANLPAYLRRNFNTENDSWIQSISDFEDGIMSSNHEYQTRFDQDQYMNNNAALFNSSSLFETMRQPVQGVSGNSPSPGWASQSATFLPDAGTPGMTHGIFPGSFSGPNAPPSTVSSCPPYLLSFQEAAASRAVNSHSQTLPITPFSNNRSESTLVDREQGMTKPNLRIDTTSHNYFKENSGAILSKWFADPVDPVAPPQLYNVPPPPSLTSQDSYDDLVSVSSYQNSQTPPTSHPQTASDISSQMSFTNGPADYGMHANLSPAINTRARRPLPDAPTVLSSTSSSFDSASMYKSNRCSPENKSDTEDYEDDDDEASNFEDTSQRATSPSAVRKDKDLFLIKARQSGMTYRDIKVKGKFTEAESTLRGRFRTLTKHRNARVRKPHWTEKDILLLRKGVRKSCKDRDPRTVKISWKTVAKYIDDNGGSYLFGNATCRKKWDELNEE